MIKFKKLPFTKEQVFFTSDTHYGHKNICKGITSWSDKSNNETRNFETVEEMNNCIVQNINKLVDVNDLLIHCGDWSFGGKVNIGKFRSEINCKNIILIQGNHDHNIKGNELELITDEIDSYSFPYWYDFQQIGYYSIEGIQFVCSHYPLLHWHQQEIGSINVHGHLHGDEPSLALEYAHLSMKSIDVGIDCNNMHPFTMESVLNLTKEKVVYARHKS